MYVTKDAAKTNMMVTTFSISSEINHDPFTYAHLLKYSYG
jgi:hypothetical protein